MVINEDAQEEASELFELVQELDDEAFDMLEAMKRLHDTLNALTELRLKGLDDDDGDKIGDQE